MNYYDDIWKYVFNSSKIKHYFHVNKKKYISNDIDALVYVNTDLKVDLFSSIVVPISTHDSDVCRDIIRDHVLNISFHRVTL